MYAIYLIGPGPRPFFGDVADALWGRGCDVDSDGDDDRLQPGGWTELTLTLRTDDEQRIDIDPLDDAKPLVLVVRSERASLARKAALFLQAGAGGDLSSSSPTGR